jgi:hypothetical protein
MRSLLDPRRNTIKKKILNGDLPLLYRSLNVKSTICFDLRAKDRTNLSLLVLASVFCEAIEDCRNPFKDEIATPQEWHLRLAKTRSLRRFAPVIGRSEVGFCKITFGQSQKFFTNPATGCL